MAYKTYESYKDSKVWWIGKIPSQWKTEKIKHQTTDDKFSIVDGPFGTQLHNDEYIDFGIPVVRVLNLDYSGKFDSNNLVFISEEKYNSLKRSSVKKGDIIVGKTGSIGKVGIFSGFEKGIISSSCLKISLNDSINHDFFKYFLISDYCFWQLDKESNGTTRASINMDQISNLYLVLPKDIHLQGKLATFLDKKILAIENNISKNKELISLLEEKKTALINQVVTKGLDPNVPMKDSGIEWIGEIPEDWDVNKLKFLTTKIGSGKTPKGGATIYVSEGIPLLRSQNIHFDSIRWDDVVFISEEINNSMLSTKVKNHDVLLNITGASIGRCYFVENIDMANVNQHVCIIRPNKRIHYKFLNYFLQSDCGQNQIFMNQNGSSREGLNFEDLSNFMIILPNYNKQIDIVNFLENEIKELNLSVGKIRENIDLLEEYKTSLIHHVVTGKIDVRDEI